MPGKKISTKGLCIDSDVLTQWAREFSEVQQTTKQKLQETILLCKDGTLTLLASNKEIQIALKVASNRWSRGASKSVTGPD